LATEHHLQSFDPSSVLLYEDEMPLSREDVLLICGRYEEMRPHFERLSSVIHAVLASVVERRGLKHMITHRAKGTSSLERKLWHGREEFRREDLLPDLSPPLKDLVGSRVLLYLTEDVEPVVEDLTRHFQDAGHKVLKKDLRSKECRYSAYHLHVTCDGQALGGHALGSLSSAMVFEIQVCTLAAHVWNELEHDIIYKQPSGKPDAAQNELLHSLHDVLDLGSRTTTRLMKHTAEQISKNTAAIIGAEELHFSLRNLLGGCVLRGDFGALFELLSGLLDPLNSAALNDYLRSGRTESEAKLLLARHDEDGNYQDAGRIMLQLLPNIALKSLAGFVSSRENPPPLFRFALRVAEAVEKGEKQS
jgi:ppGpp synthetase/RelA/SpoT-type nucleotidyltranferase